MDDATTQVLSLTALGILFGVTAPTVRRLTKTPSFPPARQLLGKRRVWIRAEVERWLAQLPIAPEPPTRRFQEGR